MHNRKVRGSDLNSNRLVSTLVGAPVPQPVQQGDLDPASSHASGKL